MKNNTVMDKSYAFALRIIKSYKYLCTEKKEFVLSNKEWNIYWCFNQRS
jgi:hypothetical protein